MKPWRALIPMIFLVAFMAVPNAASATATVSNSWSAVASMSTPRYGLAAATASDGRIYAIGGHAAGGALASVEAFTPATNSWSTVASMHVARYGAAAVAAGDSIYVMGGYNAAGGYLSSMEVYSLWNNSWTMVAPLPTARVGLAAAIGPDGRIYAIGGFNSQGYLSTVEAYTPWTNSWASAPSLPTARAFLAAAVGSTGLIYAIGGQTAQSPLATAQAYSVTTGTWTALAPMATARTETAAVAWTDGRIFAIGGRSGAFAASTLASTEAYTPATNAWTPDRALTVPRFGLAAVLGPDGLIYALGGMSSNGSYLSGVEVYGTTAPPPPTIPAPPTNVLAVPGIRSATVTWTAPYNGGSPITGYAITAYVGWSTTLAATRSVGGNTTTAQLTGLSNGATYTFTVRATNDIGWSAESARSPAITLPTPPGAPTNVAATAGLTSVMVTWLPPLSNGGSPITGYVITASTGAAGGAITVSAPASATFVVVDHLTAGRAYSFSVAAVNAVGTGPNSTPIAPVTLPTVPSSPLGLVLTPSGTSLQATWLAPALNGGSPVTGYTVTLWNGTQMVRTAQTSATSTTFTDLVTGATYTVSVVASNAIGSSTPVTQSVFLTASPPMLWVPGAQRVDHGDMVQFTVSAMDINPNAHLTLSAAGMPSGLTFTDLGNGTGQVSGSADVAAGTYPVTFTASDQYHQLTSKSVTITVTREIAIVVPDSLNPNHVMVNTSSSAASVTLRAFLYEATDPNGEADIGEAAPVIYTLTPVDGGQTYTFTAHRTGGGIEGTLEATATFKHLPVNVYHVHIEVGGNDYQGVADSMLTVYSPSATGAVTGSGQLKVSGTPGSFSLAAKYLKSGAVQGRLQYVEYEQLFTTAPFNKAHLVQKYLLKGNVTALVIKNHRAYFQGSGSINGVDRYNFVVSVVCNQYRHQADQFGLWVTNPESTTVAHFTFSPVNLSSGKALITR